MGATEPQCKGNCIGVGEGCMGLVACHGVRKALGWPERWRYRIGGTRRADVKEGEQGDQGGTNSHS